MRGSLRCAMDEETVHRLGRDDESWVEAKVSEALKISGVDQELAVAHDLFFAVGVA